jgi:hypothetical protein
MRIETIQAVQLKNNGILFHKAKNLNLTCIINNILYVKQKIKACAKTKAVYKIYKCGMNTTKHAVLIERHNILSFDFYISLMYDFNTVDFEQTARF